MKININYTSQFKQGGNVKLLSKGGSSSKPENKAESKINKRSYEIRPDNIKTSIPREIKLPIPLTHEQEMNLKMFGSFDQPSKPVTYFSQGQKKTPEQIKEANRKLDKLAKQEKQIKDEQKYQEDKKHALDIFPYVVPGLGQAMWAGKAVDLATSGASKGKYESWGDMVDKKTGSGEFVGDLTNPGYYAAAITKLATPLIKKGVENYTIKGLSLPQTIQYDINKNLSHVKNTIIDNFDNAIEKTKIPIYDYKAIKTPVNSVDLDLQTYKNLVAETNRNSITPSRMENYKQAIIRDHNINNPELIEYNKNYIPFNFRNNYTFNQVKGKDGRLPYQHPVFKERQKIDNLDRIISIHESGMKSNTGRKPILLEQGYLENQYNLENKLNSIPKNIGLGILGTSSLYAPYVMVRSLIDKNYTPDLLKRINSKK